MSILGEVAPFSFGYTQEVNIMDGLEAARALFGGTDSSTNQRTKSAMQINPYTEKPNADADCLSTETREKLETARAAYFDLKAARKELRKAKRQAGSASEEAKELRERLDGLQTMADQGLLSEEEHKRLASKTEKRLKPVRDESHSPQVAEFKIEAKEGELKEAQQAVREAVRQDTFSIAEELAHHIKKAQALHDQLVAVRQECRKHQVTPHIPYVDTTPGMDQPSFRNWLKTIEEATVAA